MFDNPSKKSFGPRLGAAWNPLGDKRMTVKGGYGIFYQPLTTSFYRGTTFRIYPYFAGVDIRQPTVFGPGNIAVLAGGRQSGDWCRSGRSSSSMTSSSRSRSSGTRTSSAISGTTSSARSATSDRRATTCRSTAIPTPCRRSTDADGVKRLVPGAALRYPSWGRIRTRINIARSNYHGMTLSLNKRFSDGWQLQASYTLGDSKDNWSGGQIGGSDFDNGAGSASDWFDPEYEYGPSSYDVRHNFVVNGVYMLPFGQDATGVKAFFAKGWQVGGVMQFSSGLPFTPFLGIRPGGRSAERHRAAQAERERHRSTIRKRRNSGSIRRSSPSPPPACSATRRRNSLRAAGVKVADLSAFKNFTFGRYQAQFRFEAFNAFNWVNFGLPDSTIFTSRRRAQSHRRAHPVHVDAGAADSVGVQVPLLRSERAGREVRPARFFVYQARTARLRGSGAGHRGPRKRPSRGVGRSPTTSLTATICQFRVSTV